MKKWLEKHPKAAQWIREGGLFLVFSYVVTFIKYLILQFLPNLYFNMVGDVEWMWPGIKIMELDPDKILLPQPTQNSVQLRDATCLTLKDIRRQR